MTSIAVSVFLLSSLSVAATEPAKDAQAKSTAPAYPAEWKSLDIEGLANVARDLEGQKEDAAKSQMVLLASYTAQEYQRLAKDHPASKAWPELARRWGGNWPEEMRKQLSTDMIQNHLSDDKAIAASSFDELNEYASAIFALGQTEPASLLWAKWTVLSEQMPSLSGENIIRLASLIRNAGDARPKASQKIIQRVTEVFLKDNASVLNMSSSGWRSLAGNLVQDMDSKQRDAWAERIQAAYVKQEINLDSVLDVENALAVLHPGMDRVFIVTWMDGKTWTKWPGEHIARLASRLRWDAPEAKQRRGEIISHFESKILGEAKTTQDVSGQDWSVLIDSTRQDLSPEQCDHWAKRIREGFLTKAMVSSELVCVESALNTLKLLAGQYFTYEWTLANEKTWQGWPGKDLSILAVHLAGNAPKAEEARRKLVEFVEKKYLVDPKAAMAIEDVDWRRFVKANIPYMRLKQASQWAKVLGDMMIARNSKKGFTPNSMKDSTGVIFEFTNPVLLSEFIQKWGMKAYELSLGTPEAREAIDFYTLSLIGEGVLRAKWNNKTKDFPEYTEVLISFIEKGKISGDHHWEQYYYLAAPLSSEKNRLKVRKSLLDEKGQPRMGCVLILSYAYRDYGSFKDWLGYLETIVNDPDIDADTKAYRLLARGLAESIGRRLPSPRDGKAWFEHSLAVVESPEARLDITRKIIHSLEYIRDYQTAFILVDQMETKSPTKMKPAVSKLRREVAERKIRAEVAEKERVQNQKLKMSRAHRGEIEKRLAKAREKGDSEKIHRYEKVLLQMQ